MKIGPRKIIQIGWLKVVASAQYLRMRSAIKSKKDQGMHKYFANPVD